MTAPVLGPGAAPTGPGPDRTGRRVRVLPVGIGLLAVSGVAALGALASREEALWLLVVALVGTVVSDLLLARAALGPAQVEVTGPPVARAGEAARHVLLVTGMTQPLVVHRPPGWGQADLTLAIGSAGPVSALLDVPIRGVHPDLVLDLVAPGPLGLTEAACRVRTWRPTPLAVTPPPVAHDPEWPRPRTAPSDEAVPVARGEALYRGLRPYRRGDPRRWVHWKASAHHGALMVKELEGLEHVALRVVVDVPVPGPVADHAVGRAEWLVDQAVARGWHVQLVTAEPPPAPRPPLGRPGWAVVPPGPTLGGRTVARRVHRPGQARPQLAAATGTPVLGPWDGMTRLVAPDGDRWL